MDDPTAGAVSAELGGGWVTFDSGRVRKRVVPIPPLWERLSDQALALLCRSADVVRKDSAQITALLRRERRHSPASPIDARTTPGR